ncbi:hypothetical protein SALBM311S_08893 [Streptomyces alboniger]
MKSAAASTKVLAHLPGVLFDQFLDVAVDAQATSQGTLTGRAGSALVHAHVQLGLRHIQKLAPNR